MKIRNVPYGLVVLAACAGAPRGATPQSGLVFLDREGRIELVADKLEVSSHRLDNRAGLLGYFVEVKNLASDPCRVRLAVRFFDAEGATEYEKIPVVLDSMLSGSETRRIEGVLDFRKHPERGKIAKMGVTVRVEEP